MNPPLFSRRLIGIAASVAVVHFTVSIVLAAWSRAFNTTLAKWACSVLTEPANALVQLVPGGLSASSQWAAFGANSILWGFCIAFIGQKWVSKRTAIASAVFLFTLVLTLAGIWITFTDAEWLGLTLAPIWASTIIAGAYFFPGVMGEVGTPLAHLIGIILNAAFLTVVVFIAIRVVNRLRTLGSEGLT